MKHRSFTTIMLIVTVTFICGTALAKETIKIGAPMPLTDFAASDGLEMKKGMELAVSVINAKGGLLGRKVEAIIADTAGGSSETVTSVAKRLLGSDVDAILTFYSAMGMTGYTSYGPSGVPFLNAQYRDEFADFTAKNLDKYGNCLQYAFRGTAFGEDFVKLLDLPKKFSVIPAKMAVIKAAIGRASVMIGSISA